MLAHLSLGDQCRIVRSNGNVALYTVAQARKESSSNHVRMGLTARKRLGTKNPFNGTLSTKVVANLTDNQAQAQDEFVERLVDDGESNGVVVLAPHGGQIELYTDQQAAHMRSLLAGKGASSWICKGYKQGGGAYERWHVASTDLSPNSFPGLSEIEDRGFAYAVSFHGTSHSGVSIGGGAPLSLKRKIRTAIRAALVDADINVVIADDDDGNTGASPDNVVNWLTDDGEGGVQIEQSLLARRHYGLDIAAAVAEVFDDLL